MDGLAVGHRVRHAGLREICAIKTRIVGVLGHVVEWIVALIWQPGIVRNGVAGDGGLLSATRDQPAAGGGLVSANRSRGLVLLRKCCGA
jgi:hypothetical protein